MQTHLDHGHFNYSHHVNELSFGPHYPNLLNPLDKTSDSTDVHFMRYQYLSEHCADDIHEAAG